MQGSVSIVHVGGSHETTVVLIRCKSLVDRRTHSQQIPLYRKQTSSTFRWPTILEIESMRIRLNTRLLCFCFFVFLFLFYLETILEMTSFSIFLTNTNSASTRPSTTDSQTARQSQPDNHNQRFHHQSNPSPGASSLRLKNHPGEGSLCCLVHPFRSVNCTTKSTKPFLRVTSLTRNFLHPDHSSRLFFLEIAHSHIPLHRSSYRRTHGPRFSLALGHPAFHHTALWFQVLVLPTTLPPCARFSGS